jgi:hypothetical protein
MQPEKSSSAGDNGYSGISFNVRVGTNLTWAQQGSSGAKSGPTFILSV